MSIPDFLSAAAAWNPVASIAVAVFAFLAAVFAAISAAAASKTAKEVEATRLQSAEPNLRVLIGEQSFVFAWRPVEGRPPSMITSFMIPVPSQPSIVVANFGGGPALDLRVTISASPADAPAPPATYEAPDGTDGTRLAVSEELLEACAPEAGGGILRIEREQTEFFPACGQAKEVSVRLAAELLARLLPRTLQLETQGYPVSGTPADLGRVHWDVHVEYRTALGKPREFKTRIYAERVRISTTPRGENHGWIEKQYWCELEVEPTDGFSTSPKRVDVLITGPAVVMTSEPHKFTP